MNRSNRDTQDSLKTPKVIARLIPDDGAMPNNPKLPLLVYQGALELPEDDPAATIEALYERNQWGSTWRSPFVHPWHHYHSNAHEAITVYSGTATLQLGGETDVILSVVPGDVLILPAGTGHKQLEASNDFGIVGGYPVGGPAWPSQVDTMNGSPGERPQADENIASAALPQADPIYGAEGPMFDHWTG